MKKNIFVIGLVIALLIGPMGWSASAQDGDPSLEEQIDLAIDSGVSWLANEQHPDGSWGGWEQTAVTCFALVKLEERAYDLGYPTPFDPGYEYADNIIAGWNYVFQLGNINKQTPLPVQWHNGTPDDPDSNANGYGVYFYTWGGHPTYTTGICLMALAASGTPAMPNQGGIDFNGDSNPDTYQELAQEAVDWLAFGQADIVWSEGGWGYGANDNANDWSDNSNSGYAVLGLAYGEAFGAVIPGWVRSELDLWIDHIQCDTAGPDFGGSGYTWDCGDWVNQLKTGNIIFEMTFFGDNPSVARFQNAIDYIETHWQDQNIDPGWGYNQYPANYQAMYTLMKGFEFSQVDSIDLDGDSVPEHDWFEEFANVLIAQQNPDGSWPWCDWGDQYLCTIWALLTLEKSVPPFTVPVDIKPASCPNPLSTKEKGVLPVGIMGTEFFDVTKIDPASVTLVGVSPLRWSLEDAGIPYEPYIGKTSAYDCIEYYPDEYGVFDGYVDLSFKFEAQEVLAALGEVNDGDVLVLQLSGNLKEEFGGTPFFGEDVVMVIRNIKPAQCNELVLLESFSSPENSHPHGLAFDGEHLWSVGYDTDTIYKLNMNGDILTSFASPGNGPTGLTFDGTYLWNADDGLLKIFKLDTSGNVISSFDAPGIDSTGLTFEGKYLWNADFNWNIPGGYLHRIDVSNPDDITFTSYASPGEGPEGLAFDGKYLWHVDYSDNQIYKLDTNANILCTYPSYGSNPIGLTFDGTYLWLADQGTGNIYKIDIDKN